MPNMHLVRKVYRRQPIHPDTPEAGAILQLLEEEISLSKPTDVMIEIHAVGLNFRDANMLNGTNPWNIKQDGVPCCDAAGTVVAVGSGVTTLHVGDRVSPLFDQSNFTGYEKERKWLGGDVDGVLATHCVFPEAGLVKVPAHLTWTEAAVSPSALTSWIGLGVRTNALQMGKSILLQGTGGVSMMALKLARAAGCRVIITSSSDEKLKRVQTMCEQEPGPRVEGINYVKYPAWEKEVLRMTGGRGVDILLENGGTTTLMQSVAATAKRGLICLVGYLGKQDPAELKNLVPLLIENSISLEGICVGTKLEREQLNQALDARQVHFEDIIDQVFGFDEASQAIAFLWEGRHVGKVVIQVKEL